jgi:imidazolonepropionase-like amidohydrolase
VAMRVGLASGMERAVASTVAMVRIRRRIRAAQRCIVNPGVCCKVNGAHRWALVNAHLIDGDPRGYAGPGGVLLDGDRILASGPDVVRGAVGDAPILDLEGRTLLPGLVDCHVHLSWSARATPVATLIEELASPERLALRTAGNALAALRRGTTTVRDLGDPDSVVFALRKAVAEGIVPGPRILAAGRVLTTPAGHCHFVGRQATDAVSVRTAAEAQLVAGADVVKIMTTGCVHTPGSDPRLVQYTRLELAAAAEVAHTAGRRITGHATCDAGVQVAVAAGLDSVQHGSGLEPPTADAMAQAGVVLTPTLATRYFLEQHLDDPAIPHDLTSKARATAAGRQAAIAAALAAGVTIAAGTDSGTTFVPHGALPTELRLLHQAGMSVRDAIAAATSVAAHEVGLPGLIGTLAPGAQADLLAVDGDPLHDLEALERTALVIVGGVLVHSTIVAA